MKWILIFLQSPSAESSLQTQQQNNFLIAENYPLHNDAPMDQNECINNNYFAASIQNCFSKKV
jgi:hypothetical protein